jgi:acetylornithine/N-succinyldiaminopimelate aminotransferase
MISQRQLFLQYVGQTSDTPALLEIERAEGIYLYDTDNKRYIDIISGVSVSNTGHSHPKVLAAVKQQIDKYMHLMVYGEYVQSPQVLFAEMLVKCTPQPLNSVYFVNSGSEAIEGALKLAKRYTGRTKILAFKNAYHGSTHGALSLMSSETFSQAFRPLLPDVYYLDYNDIASLSAIDTQTACIVTEAIQGENGIQPANMDFMQALRAKCNETGAMLIIDEVQTGMGRTGAMFAFEHYGIVPDILVLAKALGGGMPLGAFLADKKVMDSFKNNPILGHITTFGGHPVSCAAGMAALSVILDEKRIEEVAAKELLFRKLLVHKAIVEIRGRGLYLAIDLGSFDMIQKTLAKCIDLGLIFDWFLFNETSIRVAPPLTITHEEITEACQIIIRAIDWAVSQ